MNTLDSSWLGIGVLALAVLLMGTMLYASAPSPQPTLTNFTGPELNPASVTPGDSIWMPMRVFSPDGNSQTVVQWPFTMTNASSADRVYFYVHKPAYHPSLWAEGGTTDWQETGMHADDVYDEKVSFRFSSDGSSWSPWDSLTVERADCSPFARDDAYDCITGPIGQLSLRVTVELSPHVGFLQDGLNYIEMRLNNPDCTDSPCSTPAESQRVMVTDGYRLLEFEIWDTSQNDLITTTRTWDDPQQWLNPIPGSDQTNIDAGRTAWAAQDINIGFSGDLVSCQDCHAPNGFDIRFAAAHPGVVYLNAIETGKTSQEAHDIVSYIWSNDPDLDHEIPTYDYNGDGAVSAQETNPIVCPPTSTGAEAGLSGARPWNPWLQSGQLEGDRDLTSIPMECWPAGAGLAGILDQDSESFAYAQAQYEAGLTDPAEYMSQADYPLSVPLPDWHHWLADDAPAAVYGRSVWESTSPDAFTDANARASEHLMTNVLPPLIDTQAEVNALVSQVNTTGAFLGGIVSTIDDNSVRSQNFTAYDGTVFNQYIQEGGVSAPDCSTKPGTDPANDGSCQHNSIEYRVMGHSVRARQAMLLWWNVTRYKIYDQGDEIFNPTSDPDGKRQYMGDFWVPMNNMSIYAMADHMRSRWVDAGSYPTGLGVKYFSNVWYLGAEIWAPGAAGRSDAVDPNYVGALLADAQTPTFQQHMTVWTKQIFLQQYKRTHNEWRTSLNQSISDNWKARNVFYGPDNGLFLRPSTTHANGYNLYLLDDAPDEHEAFIHNSLLEGWNTHSRRFAYSEYRECAAPGDADLQDNCFGPQSVTLSDEPNFSTNFFGKGNTAWRYAGSMQTLLDANALSKGVRATVIDSTADWVEHWYPNIDWSPYQCSADGGALDCSAAPPPDNPLDNPVQRPTGADGSVSIGADSWVIQAGSGGAGNVDAWYGVSQEDFPEAPDGETCAFEIQQMRRVETSSGLEDGTLSYFARAGTCLGDACAFVYAQGRSARIVNTTTGEYHDVNGNFSLPVTASVICNGQTCSGTAAGQFLGTVDDSTPGTGDICATAGEVGETTSTHRIEWRAGLVSP